MIRVLFSALVFLFPLGAYCFMLGRINRRRHPVLVTGVQDGAGLLMAVSAFFLVVVPGILTGFHYRAGDIWLYYHYHPLPGLGHRWALLGWTFVWLVYGTVVLGGAAWLLGRRRGVSVVYNVDPAALDKALERVLDRLGYAWSRKDRRIWIGARQAVARTAGHRALPAPHPAPWAAPVLANSTMAAGEGAPPRPAAEPDAAPNYRDLDMLLEVAPWAPLRHVTLTWASGSAAVRRDVETALKEVLASVWTADHAVGMWFQTASAFVFILMFFLTMLYQYYSLLGGRVGI